MFADYAVSGLVASRPGYCSYKSLLESREHHVETTYIDDFTRASRDLREWLKLASIFNRLKKRLIGVSDNFDVNNQNSEMMVVVFGLVSNMFIKSTREKVLRGMKSTAEGPGTLGKPPLGFTRRACRDDAGNEILRTDGRPKYRYHVDEVTAQIVVEIFDLFVNKLWSPYRIAQHFNRRKVDEGDSWTDGGIRKILRNAKYTGHFIWNRFRSEYNVETEKSERIPNPESEWRRFSDPSLAIISNEVWEAAQRRLDELSGKHPRAGKARSRNENSATTLFSGTLYCGSCGKELTLFRSTEKYKVMGCLNGATGRHGCELSSSKSTRIIEEFLLGVICNSLFTEQAIEDLVVKANRYLAEEASKPRVDLRPLQQKEKTLGATIQKLLNRIEQTDDEALMANYDDRIRERQKELDAVRKEIGAARAKNSPLPPPLDADRLKGCVGDLRDLLNGEIPKAAAVLRKITGPMKIRQEKHPNGKRGARWIAEFQPNLTDGLRHLALERGYPDSATLELLSSRIWIHRESVEVVVDQVPKYEQLAPKFKELHDNRASLSTIASVHKMCWAYAAEILKFALTGERPSWGPKGKKAEGSPKKRRYVEIADEVVRLHDVDLRSFEHIAKQLRVREKTVRRAWDFAHHAEIQAAAAHGTTPKRGGSRRLPIDKIRKLQQALSSGRRDFSDIALEVGVSQNTVRRELERMEEAEQSAA